MLIPWNVHLSGYVIDTVFFEQACNAEYVRDSLINHDGYDYRIKVTRGVT